MATREEDNKIVGNKSYLRQIYPPGVKNVVFDRYVERLSPRFFIFAYSGEWKTVSGFKEAFVDVSDEYKDAHIHGACTLDEHGGKYLHHYAYVSGPERVSSVFDETGFRHFLGNLRLCLDTMVPPHRMGLGFDLVNLEHYGINLNLDRFSASPSITF